ncbi:hypothetical protein ACFX13_008477 [Malus domestica]
MSNIVKLGSFLVAHAFPFAFFCFHPKDFACFRWLCSALSHHIVLLTSSTYSLLTLDPLPPAPTTPSTPPSRFTFRSIFPSPLSQPKSLEFEPKSLLSDPRPLRGVRRTFEECNAVRAKIEGLRVMVIERDVSMDRWFREELSDLMKGKGKEAAVPPWVFVKGRYIGGSEEVLKILEEGLLGGGREEHHYPPEYQPPRGGYYPIENLNDPHLREIVDFAVSEYNKIHDKKLVFQKLVQG